MFDVDAYIESGMIEACLLGQATPQEVAEMERLAAAHPRIAAEVEAVRNTLDGLLLSTAAASATPPPAGLKAKVLRAALGAIQEVPANEPVPPTPPTKPGPKAPLWLYGLLAISTAACITFVGFYWVKTTALEERTQENVRLGQTIQDLEAVQGRMRADSLAQVARYDSLWVQCSQKVEMLGLAIAPNARAFVYWDARAGEIMAEVEMLPTPPQGMEYQLWAIVDGNPMDMGMLHLEGDTMPLARMPKSVQAPQAFAVTLEKAGGSIRPTMENMYVMGTV